MNDPRTIIQYVNIAHFLDHYAMLIYPAALVVLGPAMGLGYSELLPYATPGFIAFGAGALVTGWLGDRWSRRHMMVIFFLGIGVALIATGMARTPWQLGAALLVVGLFASIYHPVGTAMIAGHARQLGREIGINGVYGNVGVALSALITGALAQWLGWRTAFVVPGVFAIVMGVAFARAVRHEPTSAAPAPAASGRTSRVDPDAMWRVLAASILAVIATSTIFNAITVSLPSLYAERLAHWTESPAWLGALVALIYLSGAVAQYTIGGLIDRHGLRRVLVPLCLLLPPALYAISLAGDAALLAASVAVIVALFGLVTVNDTMVGKYTADRWRARAYSARYLIGFSAAGASVALVALYHERGGFPLVLQLAALLSLLAVLASLIFPRERPPQPATVPAASTAP